MFEQVNHYCIVNHKFFIEFKSPRKHAFHAWDISRKKPLVSYQLGSFVAGKHSFVCKLTYYLLLCDFPMIGSTFVELMYVGWGNGKYLLLSVGTFYSYDKCLC